MAHLRTFEKKKNNNSLRTVGHFVVASSATEEQDGKKVAKSYENESNSNIKSIVIHYRTELQLGKESIPTLIESKGIGNETTR